MNVIRDQEMGGLLMIPLFQQWGIRRCNVKDCKEKHTTIIAGVHEVPKFGLCEKHYKESKKKGKFDYTLDFNF